VHVQADNVGHTRWLQ